MNKDMNSIANIKSLSDGKFQSFTHDVMGYWACNSKFEWVYFTGSEKPVLNELEFGKEI